MKPISLSQEFRSLVEKDFAKYLLETKFNTSKVTYQFELKGALNITEKAKVFFTPDAMTKMRSLVTSTATEIAWHGIVEKLDEPNTYLITDIFMYPQYLAATTVTTEDEEYAQWIMNLPDDVIGKVRFQGHSHVNMGTFASGVDENYMNNMLGNLSAKRKEWYIFMITNKAGDMNTMIYDLGQNIIFEKEDIIVDVLGLNEWTVAEKAKYIKTRANIPATSTAYNTTVTIGAHSNVRIDDYMGESPSEVNTRLANISTATFVPSDVLYRNSCVDKLCERCNKFNICQHTDAVFARKRIETSAKINQPQRGPGRPPKDIENAPQPQFDKKEGMPNKTMREKRCMERHACAYCKYNKKCEYISERNRLFREFQEVQR